MASNSPAQAPATEPLQFSSIGRTRVEVSFDEPELTSDAGALLLREAARINGIIPAMAAAIGDGRRASHVDHSLAELLTQRVVGRIEATALGTDARFVVSDLESVGARALYETLYCARGCAELMIKEHKVFLKSSRTSCNTAEANQFRLFLHSAAYVIMHGLRETVLRGTALASATFDTLRLRLLKVAARVQAGKTLVRFHRPISCPDREVFVRTAGLAAAVRVT